MQLEKIKKMTNNIEKFIEDRNKINKKISIIENKFNKIDGENMNNKIMDSGSSDAKNAFDNFVRKGDEGALVTKSFDSGDDSAGVLVTPTLSKQIISAIAAKSPMRRLASIESISTRALDVIIEDGEFSAGWVGEAVPRGDSNVSKLRKKTIEAHEIYAQPKATQNLIDDSEINIEGWLTERLADSFVKLENESFINGDGESKPRGLLKNEDIEVVETPEDSVIDKLMSVVSSLSEDYIANASFLMNRKTLAGLQAVKDGNGRFIWQQSMSDPLQQTIFGIPVVISSHMPDMASDEVSVVLGDFKSGYKIVDRSGISLLRDPYTDKPYVRFYSAKRVGGDVVNPVALKFAKI